MTGLGRKFDTMATNPKTLNDPLLLRNLLENASKKGDATLVLDCQVRLAEIEGAKYSSQLEREFWTAVRAAEELKSADKGKTVRLTRTRQKADRVGIRQCLIDWSVSSGTTDGFKTLVAGGKAELTGEAIVIRHADEFEESVVTAAKDKLIKNGVEVSDILSKTER